MQVQFKTAVDNFTVSPGSVLSTGEANEWEGKSRTGEFSRFYNYDINKQGIKTQRKIDLHTVKSLVEFIDNGQKEYHGNLEEMGTNLQQKSS